MIDPGKYCGKGGGWWSEEGGTGGGRRRSEKEESDGQKLPIYFAHIIHLCGQGFTACRVETGTVEHSAVLHPIVQAGTDKSFPGAGWVRGQRRKGTCVLGQEKKQ